MLTSNSVIVVGSRVRVLAVADGPEEHGTVVAIEHGVYVVEIE